MSKSTYDQPRTTISADLRRAVQVESGHTCAIKGCTEHTYLEIHHIDENRENNTLENHGEIKEKSGVSQLDTRINN